MKELTMVEIKVIDLMLNNAWSEFCEFKNFDPYILAEGKVDYDDSFSVPLKKLYEWGVI